MGADVELLAAAAAGDAAGIGLVVTTFGLGLRHGIDWDHIAAITDIAGSQDDRRRALGFATLYALGHATVVFAIGVAVIAFAERLPAGIDALMERFVGVTLVLLGAYIVVALIRHGRDFRMRSRWFLLFAGARRGYRWIRDHRPLRVEVVHDHEHPTVEPHLDEHDLAPASDGTATAAVEAPPRTHRHRHRHVGTLPDDPFADYGRSTSFGVGMIHGVGGETPTQVLLFLTAAGVAGTGAAVLLLAVFLAGLFTSNTAVAVVSASGFLSARRRFPVYAAISVVTGVFSLAIGALFLAGRGAVLPGFFGV